VSLRALAHRLEPDPSEVLPLGERTGYVELLRIGTTAIVVATALFRPSLASVDAGVVVLVTLAYLGLSALPTLLRRRDDRHLLAVAQGMLLVDGIYLAWVTLVTGGAASPLRFLLFVQVMVVTLLVSYRTGLKLTAWDSLLFLVVVQAHSMRLVHGGTDAQDSLDVILTLGGLWITAFAAAAFSALNERELRRQKADLSHLADMTIAIEAADDASEIGRIVLGALVDAFGFSRGVLLRVRDVNLEVLASTDGIGDTTFAAGRDDVMERSWRERQPALASELDPVRDSRLAALLPGAHNIVVVPLQLGEGSRVGIVALEHPTADDGMRRWEVSMVAQYAAHAALALHNAWLTEERNQQLEEIRRLQGELVSYNAQLEQTVATRTEKLRDAMAELETLDDQRRRLLTHVVRAQEDERTQIANDIHDDPLQKLVAAKMRIELVARGGADAAALKEVRESLRACISSLRLLLFDLRPPILDEEGVGAAITYVLDQWDTDIEYDVTDPLGLDVPADTRGILFRIAHEAFTNARKHADATRIDVELEAQRGGYLLRIADDGVGFDPVQVASTKPGHLGLVAMRERAEIAGGKIDIYSLPGSGTVLEVWMPAPAVERGHRGADAVNVLPLDRSA
jgi:signal transduction histidine kinase